MMNFLRKHKIKIFLLTIFGFLAGTFVGFGSYLFGDRNYYDTAAVVNGQKIPYKLYYALYNNALNMMKYSNQDITEEVTQRIQTEVINSLIRDELVWQQTKKYGVEVSDVELAYDIQRYPYFLNANGEFDSKYYFQYLNNLRLSPKEFETLRRKQLASNKLQVLIASASKMSNAQIEDLKKFYKNSDENMILQIKPNEVLNDWFLQVQKNSDFKVTLTSNK